ncbi:hypothetical protein HDU82_001495 [Entophlyctis luteolus]|nr:hypothetical protein HDU82_001495 [Entophlyctis luteolus]KAJ3388758.1 hypothetical protein HDU84_009454 [Entophlyctis sp. JEL0112]
MFQTMLPVEVIQNIFLWLRIPQMFKYRRICSRINQCLTDIHFARIVVKSWARVTNLHLYQVWFFLPRSFKIATAELWRWNRPVVDLSNVVAKGDFPEEIGLLTAVTNINLSGRLLTGRLPPVIGNLTLLVHLVIEKASIGGPIPDEIGKLVMLETLNLNDNCLSGRIPETVACLSKLTKLNLSHNKLTGPFTHKLFQLRALKDLLLNDNELDGKLPDQVIEPSLSPFPFGIESLSSIKTIDIRHNKFTGYVPQSWYALKTLTTLKTSGNKFDEPADAADGAAGDSVTKGELD